MGEYKYRLVKPLPWDSYGLIEEFAINHWLRHEGPAIELISFTKEEEGLTTENTEKKKEPLNTEFHRG